MSLSPDFTSFLWPHCPPKTQPLSVLSRVCQPVPVTTQFRVPVPPPVLVSPQSKTEPVTSGKDVKQLPDVARCRSVNRYAEDKGPFGKVRWVLVSGRVLTQETGLPRSRSQVLSSTFL